jgi:hypothetical protein
VEIVVSRARHPGLDTKDAAMRTVVSLMPTAILPLLEAAINYSAFQEAPIVSPWDLDLPKDQQYTRWTSETAKLTSRYLLPFLSPAQVDHILYGYTSNVGRGVTEVGDAALGAVGAAPTKNLPGRPLSQYIGVGAVADDASFGGSPRSVSDVYDLAEALQRIDKGIKRDVNAGRIEDARERRREAQADPVFQRRGAILAAKNQFAAYGKQIKAIYAHPRMTPDEKTQRIQVIRERMIDVARRALGRPTLPSTAKEGAR